MVIWTDSLRVYSESVDQLFVFLLPVLTPPCLFFQMLSVYVTLLAALDLYLSLSGFVSFPERPFECREVSLRQS